MSLCQLRYENSPTGMPCTREAGHAPGCVYKGRSVSDGHDESEQRAEESR